MEAKKRANSDAVEFSNLYSNASHEKSMVKNSIFSDDLDIDSQAISLPLKFWPKPDLTKVEITPLKKASMAMKEENNSISNLSVPSTGSKYQNRMS